MMFIYSIMLRRCSNRLIPLWERRIGRAIGGSGRGVYQGHIFEFV
jgi:hypothetical protein